LGRGLVFRKTDAEVEADMPDAAKLAGVAEEPEVHGTA
jgi:hypothetical protein